VARGDAPPTGLWGAAPATQTPQMLAGAFHFTWVRDVPGVYAVLPGIEAALLPLGARPHWGKCFRDLAVRVDPAGKFRNEFVARTLDLR
jgi:alditol oxidase